MSYWQSYEIDGHKMIFSDNHIVLSPDTDIKAPGFFQAFEYARMLCPIIYAFHMLEQYKTNAYAWYSYDDRNLDELMEWIRVVDSQTSLDMPNDLAEFCARGKAEFERRLQKKQSEHRKEKRRKARAAGYVYVVQHDGRQGIYKIGHTRNVGNRLQTFGVQLPFEVSVECVLATPDMRALENELHEHFSDRRVNGEWFRLSESDIQYIKSLGGAK